jgi:endonuclease-8
VRAIADALRDQRSVAGIGNLFVSETLFLSGVDPWARCDEVRDLPGVLQRARRLMSASATGTGQVTTGDGRRGHEHWVYGREGQACRRCGTTVRRAVQGTATQERSTYWCPACQPRTASASATPPSPSV